MKKEYQYTLIKHTLKGVDLTPNKEGGTWLGCNRFGKIAALLNLDQEEHGLDDPTKEGRGTINIVYSYKKGTVFFQLLYSLFTRLLGS